MRDLLWRALESRRVGYCLAALVMLSPLFAMIYALRYA
jgi:hypothetical protein